MYTCSCKDACKLSAWSNRGILPIKCPQTWCAQVDINLWYYVGVYGLGKSPLDVVARHGPRGEGLRVEQQPASYPGGALDLHLRALRPLLRLTDTAAVKSVSDRNAEGIQAFSPLPGL